MDMEIGKKYNHFRIISFSHVNKNNVNVYNCKCELCGRDTLLQCNINKLKNNKSIDCGCSKRINNLVGKRFGKLVVVKKSNERKGSYRGICWECKCDCGNNRVVLGVDLQNNQIKSCGCDNLKLVTHLTHTRVHKIYVDMKNRTRYVKSYKDKGIKVCGEWLGKYGFINFYNWAMANGYKEEKGKNGYNILTLDRIDNNGNYEPSNCRFITNVEQGYNKDNTIYVEYNGIKYNFLELEKVINKPRNFIAKKYNQGYSIDQIKEMEYILPKHKNKDYSNIFNQGYIPLVYLIEKYNISEKRIRYFVQKYQIKKIKVKGKNCISIKDINKFEEHFKFKYNV